MNRDDNNLIKKVFLLAVLTREEGESMDITLKTLVNTGMFNIDEGKRILDDLIKEHYIIDNSLSMKGVILAQEAQREFQL
jgi:polyhydroxyalkanoate synthesis regulator phasin